MYPSHTANHSSTTGPTSLPLVPIGSITTKTPSEDMYASSVGSPGSTAGNYHYATSWTPAAPTTPHHSNYNPNYQGYYHQNPTAQNYISPAPMVLYPQVFTSTINQNQIHLHLSEEALANSNLTISNNRLEIGVMGEEHEQRNDVWRPY